MATTEEDNFYNPHPLLVAQGSGGGEEGGGEKENVRLLTGLAWLESGWPGSGPGPSDKSQREMVKSRLCCAISKEKRARQLV